MRLHRTTGLLLLATTVLAACTSNTATPAPRPTPRPTGAATTAAAKLVASAVGQRLAAAGLPMSNLMAQDENSDPNHLLGRPNGYTSRASFDVPGGDTAGDPADVERGGVIEVYADADGATTRSAYLQGALKANPMLGTEYHYLAGGILVRITGKVPPSVAAKFQPAVAKLA